MKKGKMRFGVMVIFGIFFAMMPVYAQTQPEETPEPEVTATPETDIYLPSDIDDIPEGWALVWNDEFLGTEIDGYHWRYDTGGTGFGNNELQYYTDKPENSFIEDGNLVIQALAEDYMGLRYTSAKLQTMVVGEWLYGRIDIRAQMPYGQGIWPAFWMLPARATYGGWPHSGEIDIMEYLGHQPETVHGTLHYSSSSGHQYTGTSYTLPEGTFADDFHIFTLIWEPERIQWYVDGMLYQ
ncbi:MAG TPA: glycoside hydrolase family 16 protein, partial [Aggregatilineales bacterium]|nr:glycoside hydrolase family 16 protein [Aggregatilineales bacterium]